MDTITRQIAEYASSLTFAHLSDEAAHAATPGGCSLWLGKFAQQRFAGRKMVEHAQQEVRLARGRSDSGANPVTRQEATKPLRLPRGKLSA